MTKLLYGKPISDELLSSCRVRLEALAQRKIVPNLLIVRVGQNPGDIWYEKAATKKLTELGLSVSCLQISEEVAEDQLIHVLQDASSDKQIHGILLLRPLPAHLHKERIENAIDTDKDVDGMSDASLIKLVRHHAYANVSCTAQAVLRLLDYYHVELIGAHVVVVGRSLTVGKPLSELLLQRNATVTVAHSKTLNLSSITKNADVVISSIGKAQFLTGAHFSKESIVVDVGTSEDAKGRICGDVDFDSVNGKVAALTPVPGGVGAITVACLAASVIQACEHLTLNASMQK